MERLIGMEDDTLFVEADTHFENITESQIRMAEALYRCWESLRRQDSKYEEKKFYKRIKKRYRFDQKKINQVFNLVFFNRKLDEEGILRKIDVFDHIDSLSTLIKRHKMNGNRYILMERTIDPRAIIIWRMAVEDERNSGKRITPKILNSLIESYAPDKAKKKRKKGVSQSHAVEGDQIVEPETEQASETFPEQNPSYIDSMEMEPSFDSTTFALRESGGMEEFGESGIPFDMDNLTVSPMPYEPMLDDAPDQLPGFTTQTTDSLDVIIASAVSILNSKESGSSIASSLTKVFRGGLSGTTSEKSLLQKILDRFGWKGGETGQFQGQIDDPLQLEVELLILYNYMHGMKIPLNETIARAIEILNSRAIGSALTLPLVLLFREGLSSANDPKHKNRLQEVLNKYGWIGGETGHFQRDIAHPQRFANQLKKCIDVLRLPIQLGSFDGTDVFISRLFQVSRMSALQPFDEEAVHLSPSTFFLNDPPKRRLLLQLEAMDRALPPYSASKRHTTSLLSLILFTETLTENNAQLIRRYWSIYKDHQLRFNTVFELRELLLRSPEMSEEELGNLEDNLSQLSVERRAEDFVAVLELYDQFCQSSNPYGSWVSNLSNNASDQMITIAQQLDSILDVIRFDTRFLYTTSSYFEPRLVSSFLGYCIEVKRGYQMEDLSDELLLLLHHPTCTALAQLLENKGAWKYLQSMLSHRPNYIKERLMMDGTTTLEIAAFTKHWAAVEFMIRQPINHDGESLGYVLKQAAGPNPDIVLLLESLSYNIPQQSKDDALLMAIRNSQHESILSLMRMGARPTVPEALDYVTNEDWLLQILLEGQETDTPQDVVYDCLGHAIIHENLSCLRTLFSKFSKGQSDAISFALERGKAICAEVILTDLSTRNDFSENSAALVTSAALGNASFVQRLIEGGARVNLPSTVGNQYALLVAIKGCSPCVEGHIQWNEDCIACTRISEASTSCVKELLDDKANVNIQDLDGRTPLHIAVIKDNGGVVELLLKKEPDMSLEDKEGLTAFQLCIKLGNDKILDLFPKKECSSNKRSRLIHL